MSISTVCIVTKPHQPDVARVAADLVDWFGRRGIRPVFDTETAEQIGRAGAGIGETEVGARAELIVVVGGDGTLLAAARLLDGRDTPILAINHGSLGFLTAAPLDELYPDLERTLDGDWTSDRRMMLDAALIRHGTGVETHRALNDVVISKGTPARIIEVEARVDGCYVSTFRADGLIVATPTGSTAYNLSASGPIVHPDLDAILLTPICSHTLTNRPLLLPAGVRIEITFRADPGEGVHATIDGQVGLALEADDRIEIVTSEARVHLVAPAGKSYFDVLRGKLKWG